MNIITETLKHFQPQNRPFPGKNAAGRLTGPRATSPGNPVQGHTKTQRPPFRLPGTRSMNPMTGNETGTGPITPGP